MEEALAEIKRLQAQSRKAIVEREARGEKPAERLTEEQMATYHRDGFVFVPGSSLWTLEEYDTMLSQVDEIGTWPDKPGAYLKYYENSLLPGHEDERILSRVERFMEHSPDLARVVRDGKIKAMCGQLLGEEAVLYKEKINFKMPGADGFKPHQDHAAGWWLHGQTAHLSTLICIDPATEANGALALVRGEHKKGLFGGEWEEIPADECKRMKWELVPTACGDVVFFDSYTPHKSGPNPSPTTRRVLYNTYAKASEGDHRLQYYIDKTANLPQDCERDPNKEYAYKI